MFERASFLMSAMRCVGRTFYGAAQRPMLRAVAGCLLIAGSATFAFAQEFPPSPGGDPAGIETLTQGPIHEAFANPPDLDPTPGPIVTRQPPEPIAEEPPEFMPEGSTWIPGYWIWDDERSDFIWVTGAARVPPPGMQYVPGYWTEVDGGWQRVAGFWMSEQVEELQYSPPPPATLEAGPSSPAPADNYFWVPGSWNYYDTGFRWRTGYWSPYRPDWVWCPARWVWTPGGYCYLPGFWDFRLSLRGHIFAPVYFQRPIYRQANWVYRPWCVIPADNLFIHLWVRPNYCHYYFGNYYGPRYANFGLRPWWELAVQRRHYDPFASYCHVHYRRQGIDFIGRVQGWHEYYARHEDRRPSRTWREQQVAFTRDSPQASIETQLFARNLVEVARRGDAPVRLTRVDQETRRALAQRTEHIRELHVARKQVEREAASVVARLPRDVVERDVERDVDRGGERDRGDKGAKQRPDVTELPRSPRAPKLRLPKPAAADVVVGGETRQQPGAKGRPGELDRPGEQDRPTGQGRGNIGRRDTIPPPMPSAAETPARGPEVSRGKGKAADHTNRTGRIDDGAKSRPALPKIDVPGEVTPDTPRVDRTPKLPKGRPPEIEVPADRSPKAKGKGRAETSDRSGRVPPADVRETPRPDVTPRPDLPVPQPQDREPRGKRKGAAPPVSIPDVTDNPRRPPDLERFPKLRPDVREPRPEPRPEVRPEPRPEARPQPRPEASPELRSKVEVPRSAPRTEVVRPRVEVPRERPKAESPSPRASSREPSAKPTPPPRPEVRQPRANEERSRGKGKDRND